MTRGSEAGIGAGLPASYAAKNADRGLRLGAARASDRSSVILLSGERLRRGAELYCQRETWQRHDRTT
jgi:hypothetical protein